VLRDLLEPLGFVIEEAGDGAACLASFARQPCDLLLLDLRMPVLGGLDTVPRLRALPHGRTLPIIAVSASVLGFNQGTALTAGCDDFLAKPVQEKELLAALDRALRLEWIWRETAAPFEPAAPLAAHDALPDAATLDALLALARGGDVDALREQLAALLARGGAGAPFLREIDALAAGFKTAGIRQKLTDARQRSSSS
jgi:CheY-like chemotaxis protein